MGSHDKNNIKMLGHKSDNVGLLLGFFFGTSSKTAVVEFGELTVVTTSCVDR
jgi:hypothetical protein